MAIFSSNLDEFFRVRVASLRNLLALKDKSKNRLDFDPKRLLKKIHSMVNDQQEELGRIHRNIILKDLRRNHIHIVDERNLSESQKEFVRDYFAKEIYPVIQPVILFKRKVNLFLKNNALYLAIRLLTPSRQDGKSYRMPSYAIIEIPGEILSRFVVLPNENRERFIIFIDDIIKMCLPRIFPGYEIESAYAVKLTRDAELYIDDEFSGDLLSKIRKGIARRKTGVPSRFLYDRRIPPDFLEFLIDAFELSPDDLVPGGRYHNYSDFIDFPRLGPESLFHVPFPPVEHSGFSPGKRIIDQIRSKDILLHFPYHSYEPVIRFLDEAATDASVTQIHITLYRVSPESRVVKSLIRAARNGKDVTAFVEIKARFDEESNIRWADEMIRAGIKVLYSFPGLKVHSKLCLISGKSRSSSYRLGYLSTGNFNENTARIYTDLGLFTSDPDITSEMREVFGYLESGETDHKFKHLLVAPFTMRKRLNKLISGEIANAREGKRAGIILKLNSVEDPKIIDRLYQAARAGVSIRLLVRGICCLNNDLKDVHPNISVTSIVDRFLEHSRIYIFHNNDRPEMFVSSADWMRRNLNRRIEVAFPIYDPDIREELNTLIDMQLADNTKARILDSGFRNAYRRRGRAEKRNAQSDTYTYYRKKSGSSE